MESPRQRTVQAQAITVVALKSTDSCLLVSLETLKKNGSQELHQLTQYLKLRVMQTGEERSKLQTFNSLISFPTQQLVDRSKLYLLSIIIHPTMFSCTDSTNQLSVMFIKMPLHICLIHLKPGQLLMTVESSRAQLPRILPFNLLNQLSSITSPIRSQPLLMI